MHTENFWVGLDVGGTQTNICVIDDRADVLLEEVTQSTGYGIAAILEALTPLANVNILLEAGMGNRLARDLNVLGYRVVVLDTNTTSKFLAIRRNKTDINDARGLAELCRIRSQSTRTVHVKSAECQRLRSQLVLRDQMVRQKTAIDNALRSYLREHTGSSRAAPPRRDWQTKLEAEFRRLKFEEGLDLAKPLMPLLKVRKAVDAYVRQADIEMNRIAKSNLVTKRLMQIPGVGPICAISFYTAIEDPLRFSKSTNAGAYLGLVPRVRQSGTIFLRYRISKAGNKLTRSHLVMAAAVILSRAKDDSKLRRWAKALQERVGYRKAKVAVARKLSAVMISVWKSGGNFDPFPATSSPSGATGLDLDHMSRA